MWILGNSWRSSAFVYLLLGLALLAGLALRTWNVRFDEGIGSHPDERSTACFYAASIEWPRSWEEFREPTRSPLNPLWNRDTQERRSFTYGHFPLYLGVALGEILHRLSPLAETLSVSEHIVTQMRLATGPAAVPSLTDIISYPLSLPRM